MSDNNAEDYVAEKLTFTKDKLEVYLLKHEKYRGSKSSYQFWAGISITLIITVLSSTINLMDFKHPVELIITIACALTTIISIYLFLTHILKTDPVKELQNTLHKNYINKPDRNALFVATRVKHNEKQILVFKNKAWGDCYFLPYTKIEVNHSEQDIRTKIADLLDLETNEIEINKLLDKQEITEKFHPQENVVKEYHTTYFHLSAHSKTTQKNITDDNSFKVSNKQFVWKTLQEIENDPSTQNTNRDVLDVLRNNKSVFITNSSTFNE